MAIGMKTNLYICCTIQTACGTLFWGLAAAVGAAARSFATLISVSLPTPPPPAPPGPPPPGPPGNAPPGPAEVGVDPPAPAAAKIEAAAGAAAAHEAAHKRTKPTAAAA